MPFERFGEVHHGGPHPLAWLLFALLLALLVLLVLNIAVGLRERQRPWRQAAAGVPSDPSLAELRLRYARGEIDRIQFLQMGRDLGGTQPDGDTPKAAQTPP